jgi:hypothetical protein
MQERKDELSPECQEQVGKSRGGRRGARAGRFGSF